MQSDILELAARRMAWLDQRQSLLARNVANADTPGYRPRDLSPFRAAPGGADFVAPAMTDPAHLPGVVPSEAPAAQSAQRGPRAPDGNAVALEAELMKVADTDAAQQTAVNLQGKYAGLFRIALGRGQ